MMKSVTPPQLGAKSYSCPQCGALAHQNWFKVFLNDYGRDEKPDVVTYDSLKNFNISKISDEKARERFAQFIQRLKEHSVTQYLHEYGVSCGWELQNVNVSRCYSCSGFAVWVGERLAHPVVQAAIVAHDDMPAAIVDDFNEAALIVEKSPRGAAALLRLCIQKLLPELGVQNDNLNAAIGDLVRKGLDTKIQKALDVVRVIGNNAVHPGQIDMKDNKATALHLFALVNVIVAAMISTKKQIDQLYEGLPAGALEAIDKRDGKAALADSEQT